MNRYSSDDGEDTPFGFRWGAATVQRSCSHRDTLVIDVMTPRRSLSVYVSPTGLLRVFDPDGKELLPSAKRGTP